METVNKKSQKPVPQILQDAEANYRRTLHDVGKIRGNGGGWKAEKAFQVASRQLYEARLAVGFELTKMEASGMHYIISVPEYLNGH